MSKDDVKELIITIVCCFPSFKPDDVGQTIDKWYEQLKNIDYKEADAELSRYIQNNSGGYAPSVSNLIPKKNQIYGFTGRTYSHEFFEELEKEATEQWQEK